MPASPSGFEMSRAIELYIKNEKKLNANVDFYSASTYATLGIDIDLYTPIFAISRIAGWAAHVIEQLDDNRLIRPRAEYIGPVYPSPLDPRRRARLNAAVICFSSASIRTTGGAPSLTQSHRAKGGKPHTSPAAFHTASIRATRDAHRALLKNPPTGLFNEPRG